MSKLMQKQSLVPALVLLGVLSATSASAITIASTVYDFSGTCLDCAGTATAELTLWAVATHSVRRLRPAISSASNYDGTNLVSPFTVLPTDSGFSVAGMITTVPGPNFFTVDTESVFFDSSTNGTWCVGGSCASDFGLGRRVHRRLDRRSRTRDDGSPGTRIRRRLLPCSAAVAASRRTSVLEPQTSVRPVRARLFLNTLQVFHAPGSSPRRFCRHLLCLKVSPRTTRSL